MSVIPFGLDKFDQKNVHLCELFWIERNRNNDDNVCYTGVTVS